MNFGEAIQALKDGKRVARAGWNGKNMALHLEDWLEGKLDFSGRQYEPCIVMLTAQGKFQPGWLASQADMLADDWELTG
jgi:hypothetical protein